MVFRTCGGDKRDRTADLLNAIQALSQLSYTPIFSLVYRASNGSTVNLGGDKRDRTADLLNAIQALSQLSYTPIFCQHSADDPCILSQIPKMSSIFSYFFVFLQATEFNA